ncbi:MAG: Rne/Rng family ribonuclease [Chitinophagaceae bacterium]|nr:Rne/Rng family ribonuclease [Chitinophagaceae bacterium]
MNKELIINASGDVVEIALLEDKRLVELHYEQGKDDFAVGDLYLGKVKKLMPGLNAAFVDVGYEKDAFLHYTDLSPHFNSLVKFSRQSIEGNKSWGNDFSKFKNEPVILKAGKITEVIHHKPEIVVQILKEPISAKGPRLSCEISLPGRFLVMTPFNDSVSVSRKIHSAEERKRLQKIVEAVKPRNYGMIVRTAAEGKGTEELHADVHELVNMWDTIQANLKGAKAPQKILGEQTKTTSILRDLLNDSFQRVVSNDKRIADDAREYISRIAPEKAEIVSFHNNSMNIFDQYGVSKQVKASFGQTVSMGSGSYLIIQHTEALHVIDVNSGTRSADAGQEQNALATNLEAVAEIARQMRLRDLGGIVIVDFIDMKLPENKRQVFDAMEAAMGPDRARHTILPISKFGLMQITRQRLRPELNINTSEECPTCKGTGKIGPTMLLADNIERDLNYLVDQGHRELLLKVHPIVEAYLTKGFFFSSIRHKWSKKYRTKLTVAGDNSFPITQYRYFDARTNDSINL